MLVPVHTMAPKEFQKLFQNVTNLDDGQTLNL